jgi:hypothetical protein
VTVAGRPLATRYYFEPPDRSGIAGVARAIPRDAVVGEYRVDDELLYLKMDRPVAFLQDEAELREFLAQPGGHYLIARPQDAPLLARLTDRPLREVGTWPLGDKRETLARVLEVAP